MDAIVDPRTKDCNTTDYTKVCGNTIRNIFYTVVFGKKKHVYTDLLKIPMLLVWHLSDQMVFHSNDLHMSENLLVRILLWNPLL
jgi:hypothetical protein